MVSGDTVGFSVVFRNEICVISLLKIDTLSCKKLKCSPYNSVVLMVMFYCGCCAAPLSFNSPSDIFFLIISVPFAYMFL